MNTERGSPPRRSARWAGLQRLAGRAALVVVVLGAVTVAIVFFTLGESIFGSSRGTIDSYNADALDATPLFPGATLIQSRVTEVVRSDGRTVRYLERLYVTEAARDDVVAFYSEHRVPAHRGVSVELLPEGFRWPDGPGVTVVPGEAPRAQQAVFVLRAGQRFVNGWF